MNRRDHRDRRDFAGLDVLTETIIGAAIQVHRALGLSGRPVGQLLDFDLKVLKHGLKRRVNGFAA